MDNEELRVQITMRVKATLLAMDRATAKHDYKGALILARAVSQLTVALYNLDEESEGWKAS